MVLNLVRLVPMSANVMSCQHEAQVPPHGRDINVKIGVETHMMFEREATWMRKWAEWLVHFSCLFGSSRCKS